MLALIVEIRHWLQEDRHTPYAERLSRDRGIGRELGSQPPASDPAARVVAWWERLGPRETSGLGHRVAAGRRLAGACLLVLGVLAGSAVGGIAFAYDGSHPINLATLLGVLVGLPALMLLLTLMVLPGRVPGLGAVQAVAAGISPGRWAGAWLDRLLGAELFAPGLLSGSSTGAFSRWQLVVFSQWLALGFFAGVLAAAVSLVTFTDLAFGWSTTLQISTARVEGWVEALAAPWAGWFPAAAPDAALVEASRYNRLDTQPLPRETVQRLGAWWPFVLMVILVYGALPRLLLLLFGSWRLQRATERLLLDDPEVTALLDRLDTPLIGLGGEAGVNDAEAPARPAPGPEEAAGEGGVVGLIWNGALSGDRARAWLTGHLGAAAADLVDVGILQSAPERLAALDAVAGGEVRRLVLMTKGWEPPLLEFMDFIGLLRERFGTGPSITVVPIDVEGAAVRRADRTVWARALGRLGDPRLYVMPAADEAAAADSGGTTRGAAP